MAPLPPPLYTGLRNNMSFGAFATTCNVYPRSQKPVPDISAIHLASFHSFAPDSIH